MKISSSKASKQAPGPDNITSKLLQVVKAGISLPLAMLFQKSLYTGQLPDAHITLFKFLRVARLLLILLGSKINQ